MSMKYYLVILVYPIMVLTTQIDRYNELIIERKRLLRTSTESNPMIVNLDTSIRAMKANVKAAIDGTLQGLAYREG